MRFRTNDKYRSHIPAIKEAIAGHYTPLKTFCNGRNVVHLLEIDGRKMVLKIFKPANIVNGLIYTLFRKSKARRAFEYALQLKELDIPTPLPVAFAEKSRMGIFHRGYFLAEYVDAPSADSIFYSPATDEATLASMAQAISDFTLMLHLKGVQPLDYNTGNLLVSRAGDNYSFQLIDINRMRFGRVPRLHRAMKSFFQLGTYPRDYHTLLGTYCHRRGYDFETSLYHVLRYRRAQQRLRKVKKFFRTLLHLRREPTQIIESV